MPRRVRAPALPERRRRPAERAEGQRRAGRGRRVAVHEREGQRHQRLHRGERAGQQPAEADHRRHPAAQRDRAAAAAAPAARARAAPARRPAPAPAASPAPAATTAPRRRRARSPPRPPAGRGLGGAGSAGRRSRRSVGTSAAIAAATSGTSPRNTHRQPGPVGQRAGHHRADQRRDHPGRGDRAEHRRPQPLRVLVADDRRTSTTMSSADAEALQRAADAGTPRCPARARRSAARPGTCRPRSAAAAGRRPGRSSRREIDHADHRGDQQRGERPAVPGQPVQLPHGRGQRGRDGDRLEGDQR